MNKQIIIYLGGLLLLFANFASGQKQHYSTANGHAHNDYMNVHPFTTAFENRFGSIEVDVFPVNGKLLVAHDRHKVDPLKTIDNMYLHPLAEKLITDSFLNIKLLVDIKEGYKESLTLLMESLRPIINYLSVPGKQNRITILISGRRPPPSEYELYPSYIFFDDDLRLPHDPQQWNRVGQVSLQFSRYSTWNGQNNMKHEEKQRLLQVIDSVHLAGKTIRFWGAPDIRNSWECQVELGVDLIGTDRIEELSAYLRMLLKAFASHR